MKCSIVKDKTKFIVVISSKGGVEGITTSEG